jgi:hypothetical protein
MATIPFRSFGRLEPGHHVKVGPTKPNGDPHPHAGKTGTITKLEDWATALVRVDPGIEPQGVIYVSMACLNIAPISRMYTTKIYTRHPEEIARIRRSKSKYPRRFISTPRAMCEIGVHSLN